MPHSFGKHHVVEHEDQGLIRPKSGRRVGRAQPDSLLDRACQLDAIQKVVHFPIAIAKAVKLYISNRRFATTRKLIFALSVLDN